MEVLRVDFDSAEALESHTPGSSTNRRSAMDDAPVWSRLFRHFTLQAPLTNRLLVRNT